MLAGAFAKPSYRLIVGLPVILISLSTTSCTSQKSRFIKAERLESQGRWTEAVSSYEHLLTEIRPQNRQLISDTYAHVGYCLLKLERAGESLAALEKAVEVNPQNDAAHLHLIELYVAAGVPERATPEADYLLKRRPTDVQAVAAVGAVYAAQGRTNAAEELLLRAFHVDRKRVEIAEALADLYYQDEKIDQARAVLREAASAQPHDFSALLHLARIEEQQGNNLAAEQYYREAVVAQDRIETNLRLAQFLQRTSKLTEAQEILKKVDEMRPQTPFSAPDMDLMTGHWANAVRGYEAALKSLLDGHPKRPQPHERWRQAAAAARMIEADLQIALRQSGAPGSSQAALASAKAGLARLRLSLDAPTISVLESEIALAAGDLSQARKHAEAALADGEPAPSAHYVLGLTYYNQGNIREALTEWESALEQDGTYYPARLALANAELQQRHIGKAEEYVMDVVREEPANTEALLLYARILFSEERYDSAHYLALRAAVADVSSAEPHVVMGEVALAQHHRAEALVELEKAIVLNPRSAAAIKALTALYRTGTITRPMLKRMEATANAPPASATLMEIAGRLYADHGWYGNARHCLQRAIELDNSRSTSLEALARTYAAEGPSKNSDNLLTDSKLPLTADNSPWNPGSAVLLEAVRAQNNGNQNVAIESYEAALRQGENTGVAANNLAWIYAQTPGNLDRALLLAEQAFAAHPRDPAVLDTLGYVLLHRREYTRALDVLIKANELLVKTPGPRSRELTAALQEHLREACLHSGQPELATQASNWGSSSGREHN